MSILTDALMEGIMSEVMSGITGVMQQMMWLVVLISIPALALAVAYCFFGIRIYRVLLVINGVISGGAFGAVVLGLVTDSGAGAVIGFLLFGALIGALSWYIYKVFLFIQTFFTGFSVTATVFLLITQSIPASLIIGIIVGMVLGVLICIYTKLFVMIMTAYQGAGSIASILSLFFIGSKAYSIVNILLLVIFAVAGFCVQNYMYNSKPCDSGETNQGTNGPRLAGCMLVGIEGMYKGFEFDIEDTLTLGRDVDNCNIIFPDTCAGVSRIQCQFTFNQKSRQISVVDRFSSYGTTLNGTRLEINKVTPLKNGDVIMFGENNVFKIKC